MNEPNETRDFFISFTGADRDWAAWIAWTIEEAGYSVWFQDWDFRGNFVLEMDRSHTRSRRTIAVLSPAYFESRFTAPEWAARFAEDGTSADDLLVPVRVADFRRPGLLAQIIYVDLVGIDAGAAREKLLQRISGLRRKPTEPPPFPGKPVHREVSERPVFPGKRATHNLPPHNPDFVGREAALDAIQTALAAPDEQPLVVTQAITGLGGVGKTQTALAFAHRQLADRDLVWWLNAETPAKLAADYAAMAGPLGIAEAADEAALNRDIRNRLQSSDGWLLVFDNVEVRDAIRTYLPASGGGRVLITSRRTDWHGLARTLPLDVMSEPEALRLLTGQDDPSSSLAPADLAEAKALAENLGYLPLALAQARAFMTERGYGLAAYRKLFAERLVEVMARGADGLDPTIDASADPDARRRQRAVAATWDISIEAAAATAPGARELLQLLAFFAPDPLPRDVLAADATKLPESLRDELARSDALAALARLSLVDATEAGITCHRLVQSITRESLKRADPDAAATRAGSAVCLLLAAMPEHRPDDHRSWGHHERMLAHHLAATSHAEALEAALPSVARLLNETAVYFEARASYNEAEPLYKGAIAINEKALRPEAPALATILSNLASLYRATGRYDEAETLYERAIAIDENVLGPVHPDLATSLNNLATLYHGIGRYDDAVLLYQRALAITKKAPLNEYPKLAIRLRNLAGLHKNTGHHNDAEAILGRTVVEEVLGPEAPALATILNNLASLYRATGHYGEAESLYESAIAIVEKVLGPEAPALATILNNLASLCHATGRYDEAESLYERAIAIDESSLNPESPDLATTLNNIANLYRDTGRFEEAKSLYKRAVAIGDKVLSPEHPDSAVWLSNLAELHQATGRYNAAELLYERAIAIIEKALGPEHRDLTISLSSLAGLYLATGRHAEAEPLYQRAIAIIEAALPADHPHQALFRDNYADLLEALDRHAEAEELRARAQAVRDARAAPGNP